MITTELKLKKILENLDVLPNKMSQYMGDDTPKLTKEQKMRLMTMIESYNEYGKIFDSMDRIMEVSKVLKEISNMAETYAVNECGDWFASNRVKKDFSEVKKRANEFDKYAKECYTKMQEMTALYEDVGNVLKRYYSIKDLTSPLPKTAPESTIT